LPSAPPLTHHNGATGWPDPRTMGRSDPPRKRNFRLSIGGIYELPLHRVLGYSPVQSKRPVEIPIPRVTHRGVCPFRGLDMGVVRTTISTRDAASFQLTSDTTFEYSAFFVRLALISGFLNVLLDSHDAVSFAVSVQLVPSIKYVGRTRRRSSVVI